MTSFNDAVFDMRAPHAGVEARRRFRSSVPDSVVPLRRRVERFPYVPADPAVRDERCREAYNIQVQGLASRLAGGRYLARR